MVWKRGTSGNPAGRGKGKLNKRTELSKLIDPHAPEIINRLVALALSGEIAAIKLVIDRIIPVPKIKQEPLDIQIPATINEKTLEKLKADILHAVFDGRLVADEAEALIKLIAHNYDKQGPTATINFSGMNSQEAARVYQQIMREG